MFKGDRPVLHLLLCTYCKCIVAFTCVGWICGVNAAQTERGRDANGGVEALVIAGQGEKKEGAKAEKRRATLQRMLKEIEAGGDINATDKLGQTALMYAAVLKERYAVAWLLAKGADATLKSRKGKTAAALTEDECIRTALEMLHTKPLKLTAEEIEKKSSPKEFARSIREDTPATLNNLSYYLDKGQIQGELCFQGIPGPLAVGLLMRKGIALSIELHPDTAQEEKSPEVKQFLAVMGIKRVEVEVKDTVQSNPPPVVPSQHSEKTLMPWLRSVCTILQNTQQTSNGERRSDVVCAPPSAVNTPLPTPKPVKPERSKEPRIPVRMCIEFSTKSKAPVNKDEKNESYCASGYVFQGVATVYYQGTDDVRTFEVQSGGWMHAISPFYRAGDRPKVEDVEQENYIPAHYPDTAFPNLVTACAISTRRGGMNVDGFSITDYPKTTGRLSLFLHRRERYGTEGCISSDYPEWEAFCKEMEAARRAKVKKIPLTVIYTCELPDTARNLTKSPFQIRINGFDTKMTR